MKNIHLKYYFLMVMVLCLTACDPDEFYDQAGSTEVKTCSVNVTSAPELYYDFSDFKSLTYIVDQGSETAFGSAVVKKRFNDGPWVDHATLTSFPATIELSLDDVLAGSGVALTDLVAGDYAEFAFLLDGEFLNGHTAIPLVCSSDVTIDAESISTDVFLEENGLEDNVLSFDYDVVGPAPVETLTFFATHNGETAEILATDTWPGSASFTLGELLDAVGSDEIAFGEEVVVSYILTSAVDCASTVTTGAVYACPVSVLQPAMEGDPPLESRTYEAKSAGEAGGGNGTFDIVDQVTLAPGANAITFALDDISFGMYEQFWSGARDPGDLRILCGEVTMGPNVDQYGDTVTGSGSIDDETGIITLKWSNTYGDKGDVTLTPVE